MAIPEDRRKNMARKSPQQFAKRQKEMERAKKAREKMAKRQEKKEGVATETDPLGTPEEPIAEEA
jgi:hypothetical protein